MAFRRTDDIIIYTGSASLENLCIDDDFEKRIAEWIIDNYECNIIIDILSKDYEGLSEADKKEITEIISNDLTFDRKLREEKIENCLKKYLETEKKINLGGFVRFRLKEYRAELEKITENIVEKFITEKEYIEFAKLLREFVNYQYPRMDFLSVSVAENKIEYKDKNGNDIKPFIDSRIFLEDDLSEEDKVLTVLVMLAPTKLSVCFDESYNNENLKKIIEYIFGETVFF